MDSTTETEAASTALARELEALQEKLDALRGEADETESTSNSLKERLREAEDKLALTQGAISDYERAIAEKEEQLTEAERRNAIARYEEAGAQLAETITNVLEDLEAYESAEQAVAAVEGNRASRGMPAEPEVVREPWELLKETVRRRSDVQFQDELVEAAARSRVPSVIDSLPAHLREAARARVQARKSARS